MDVTHRTNELAWLPWSEWASSLCTNLQILRKTYTSFGCEQQWRRARGEGPAERAKRKQEPPNSEGKRPYCTTNYYLFGGLNSTIKLGKHEQALTLVPCFPLLISYQIWEIFIVIGGRHYCRLCYYHQQLLAPLLMRILSDFKNLQNSIKEPAPHVYREKK